MRISALALSPLVLIGLASHVDANGLPPIKAGDANPVPACATPGRLMSYLASRNNGLDGRYARLAAYYQRHGEAAGLRWDYAFFQMIVETASLSFRRPGGEPSTVRPEQNNFAGLGASGGGTSGESFSEIEHGVVAHLQHLQLYAGDAVPAPIAERTRKVQAWGILVPWQKVLAGPVGFADLARKWAPTDPSYGPSIESVGRRFYAAHCGRADPSPAAVALAKPIAPRGDAAAPPVPAAPLETIDLAEEPPLQATAPRVVADAHPAETRRMWGLELLRKVLNPPTEGLEERRSGLGAADLAGRDQSPPAPARRPLQEVQVLRPSQPEPQVKHWAPEADTAQPTTVPAAAVPASPAPVVRPPVDPREAAIRSLIVGRTVLLDTPVGSVIPIAFAAEGTMKGRAGSLSGYLGAAHDDGRWWVNRGRLCQRWKVWFERETQCLRFRQSGEVIHWTRDDGTSGTARLARH